MLTEDQIEQLWGEIENEGLGYWIQNYGYSGTDDPKLAELCSVARKALNEFEQYAQTLGII